MRLCEDGMMSVGVRKPLKPHLWCGGGKWVVTQASTRGITSIVIAHLVRSRNTTAWLWTKGVR